MIFVSYSHDDESWRKRFEKIFEPLKRYECIECWSDRRIRAGQTWKSEIDLAMQRATVAVLLVSDNFLASDFIANQELPYFLQRAGEGKVIIKWVLLTPCLWTKTRLRHIQAFCVNELEPLIGMNEFRWRETFCKLCDGIDEEIRKTETPIINPALTHCSLNRVEKKLKVLAAPAKRDTEVLLYCGDGKWYVQEKVTAGSMTADCWIGDEKNTRQGSTFTIVAITTDGLPLRLGSAHDNIPEYRTKSEELMVRRR